MSITSRGILTAAALVALFGLTGCATESRVELPPWVSLRAPASAPESIRTLGPDGQFVELTTDAVGRRLPPASREQPLRILALSGGGAGGAFGAGALVGLTEAGSRPEFTAVTGVSAGALIAPYAFLGSSWDAQLAQSYTSGEGQDVLQPRGLGALFGSSLYRGAPLRNLVDRYVTDDLLTAVAIEAEKGRLLLVATTNVDSGQAVIWDLGSIARYGGTQARALFRDVLVASASVPGLFPPVVMHFRMAGQVYDEAHVDGGVTLPFFIAPQLSEARTSAGSAEVFVLIDGPLDELPRATPRQARDIFARSVATSLHAMMRTKLELEASSAAAHGIAFEYTALPAAYPHHKSFDFSAANMRPMFAYAARCAQNAHLWTPFTHAAPLADGAVADARGTGAACPADDAMIERLARAAP
jgi:predicted acylesterase/phospholipase RssA